MGRLIHELLRQAVSGELVSSGTTIRPYNIIIERFSSLIQIPDENSLKKGGEGGFSDK